MAENIDPIDTFLMKIYDYSARTSFRLVMPALYSSTALITTVLNSLILISIWKTPSLHKPSYILIGSLALSDLLVGAIGEPLMVVLEIVDWSLNDFSLVFKSARGVCYGMAGISLLNLTFISLDRLLAVKLMNRYQSIVTRKRVLCVLLTSWIGSGVFVSTLLSKVNLNVQNVTAGLLTGGIFRFVLVVTITVCYSMAFYSLRKITSSSVSPSVQNAEAVARPSFNIDIAKYRKSLVTMFVVFICTILFYTPFVVNLIVTSMLVYKNASTSKKPVATTLIYFAATEFFSLLNSAMNPLLYLWRMRDIREAVKTSVKRAFKVL